MAIQNPITGAPLTGGGPVVLPALTTQPVGVGGSSLPPVLVVSQASQPVLVVLGVR